jgi:hypothetical protein
MPLGLRRYQQERHDHLITFSCHNCKPYLNTPRSRDAFLAQMSKMFKLIEPSGPPYHPQPNTKARGAPILRSLTAKVDDQYNSSALS